MSTTTAAPTTHGPDRPTFIWDWSDLGDLTGRRLESRPWTMVESATDGDVAVGPTFGLGRSCFNCYVARRSANGGRECRPAAPTAAQRHAVGALVISDLDGVQLVIDQRGVVASRHRLLPSPTCPCDSATTSSVQLEDAVSERLGIVHRLDEWHHTETGTYMCIAVAASTSATLGQVATVHGLAAGRTSEAARTRAVAEALERYSAAWCPPGRREVAAFDLLGRSAGHLPSARVQLPFRDVPPGTLQTSNGLAAGPSRSAAVRSAVGELAERHVFMDAWHRGSGFARVPRVHDDPAGVLVSRVQTDLAHVFVAGFESPFPPYTAVGLGAGWDAATAREHAVLEACAARAMLQQHDLAGAPWPPRRLEDHALAHAVRPELRSSRRRMWSGSGDEVHLSGSTWDAFVQSHPRIRIADVTAPDVAPLGVAVVRAVAPHFEDLAADGALELSEGRIPHPVG